MEFDYTKLKKEIKRHFRNREYLCKMLDIDKSTLSLKLNNKQSFTTKEIYNISKILGIEAKDIPSYFFKIES